MTTPSSQQSKTFNARTRGHDEWLTPPHIVRAFGPFDLDPCSPINRPWDTAANHYSTLDDGLSKPWHGRVWLNPPYGRVIGKWLARMADHGNGIALIMARTETRSFHDYVWSRARALLFLEGRLSFHYVDGTQAKHNCGAPSVLIAYDDESAEALKSGQDPAGLSGRVVWL